MSKYFDTHTHQDYRPECPENSIQLLLVQTSLNFIAPSLHSPTPFFAIGIHPQFINSTFSESDFIDMMERAHVSAIGEIGLDFSSKYNVSV